MNSDKITAKELIALLTIVLLSCSIDSIADIAFSAFGL